MEVTIKCVKCGREFKDNNCPSRRRKCCSLGCAKAINVSQLVHGKRENCPNWRGGTTKDWYGYIKILVPDCPMSDSKGYVAEHRYVMSQLLGRILEPEEVVHHVNGIITDNRKENLRLMTQKSHKSLHGKGRPMPQRWKK